ncbi:hypothetical protein KSX_34720 [Ktedonospora formicarum]|uniref:Uncharacterized protein n=2 Tax=Ktedonospora formicarum TaxID=2778364 RepID=A0A8J3I5W6_9CHLR|nr:hypothetical protein KSX_34720 [Ktedonospora formicarum]
MVLTTAAVTLVLLLKRKQDEKARKVQKTSISVPWIDPQEGNVVFGHINNPNNNSSINNELQNIFSEQQEFPPAQNIPQLAAMQGNSGVMPALVPPTAPANTARGNSGLYPAISGIHGQPTLEAQNTASRQQYATLAVSEGDQTNPRTFAVSNTPPTSAQSQPPNVSFDRNLQPLPMDLPPELRASLEATQREARSSNGPLSFSGLQEDPFLEEMMQQAQMGIFVMPNKEKGNDASADGKTK